MVFTCNGIYTLDPYFNVLNTTNGLSYNNYKENIAHFSDEDGGYFLYISDYDHHFFSPYGKYLASYSHSLSRYFYQYSVVPYNHIDSNYYYYLIYIESSDIILRKFVFNSNNNIISLVHTKTLNRTEYNFISCELMKFSNKKVIACFYPTYSNNSYYFICNVYDPENNYEIIKTKISNSSEIKNVYSIKSSVMNIEQRQKALFCALIMKNSTLFLYYIGYEINSNSFNEGFISCPNNCNFYLKNYYYFSLSFFKETEQFVVSIFGNCNINGNSKYFFYIYTFDNNFNYNFFGTLRDLTLGDSCCNYNNDNFVFYSSYDLHSILFSSITQKYCFIGNLYNGVKKITMFIINKDINIINPVELKSTSKDFICEDYTNYKNQSCLNNENIQVLNDTSMNYLEKCSSEKLNCACNNLNYKSFEFSFNCSAKIPYELVEENKCVEYCDNDTLIANKCIKNYFYEDNIISNSLNEFSDKSTYSQSESNLIDTTDILPDSSNINLEEIINTQSDSSLFEDKNSIDTLANSILISDSDIKTDLKDSISEEKNYTHLDIFLSENKDIIEQSSNIQSYSNFFSDKDKKENLTDKATEETIYEKLDNILNENNNIINANKVIENIKELISSGAIDSFLDNIIDGDEDIVISNSQTVIQITSTDKQKNNKNYTLSSINLGECENILKMAYNINPNSSLLILKIDSALEGAKIPIIQYEVYHPVNKSKLNLNLCDNTKIEINIPVSIDESSLYKYDANSGYYNDRCYTYTSENGTDIPLTYRREEFINNNMSLCESECDYLGYNNETKNSKCECNAKNEISLFNIKIDTERLYENFGILKSSNIDIIKCYYLLFMKEYLINNIGNYVILFIILLFIIGAFTFILKGYNLLGKKINYVLRISKNTNNNRSNFKSHTMVTSTILTKNTNKSKNRKRTSIKNKNKDKKKNNPPLKKENKKIQIKRSRTKKISLILDISEGSKSTQKFTAKHSEGEIRNINNGLFKKENKKGQKEKNEKSRKNKKYKTNIINKTNKTNNSNQRRKTKLSNKFNLDKNIVNSKGDILNIKELHLNDYEINRLQYKEALQYDKRTYFQYYWSLLKTGHLFLFSFIPNNDYNSMILKICLFFFSFGLYYTVNALFFTDSTMNKIYENKGEYDFIYQIPKILYSNLICTIINLIVKTLSLTERDILKLKTIKRGEDINLKVAKIKKCLIIKFILYYLISFIFLAIFWFYVSCFCAVYKNTQLYLIKDTIISFGLSLLYPLGYYLIPGVFRIPSLRSKEGNKECIYQISLLFQLL